MTDKSDAAPCPKDDPPSGGRATGKCKRSPWIVYCSNVDLRSFIQDIKRRRTVPNTLPLALRKMHPHVHPALFMLVCRAATLAHQTRAPKALSTLVELLTGLDYGQTSGVGRIDLTEFDAKPLIQRHILMLKRWRREEKHNNPHCWAQLRVAAMDIFTACKMAACTTPLCVFYGGSVHTRNVATALVATGSLGARRTSLKHRGPFIIEELSTAVGRFVFLGENHSRTPLATARQLIADLKLRCNHPDAVPCTLFLERHRALAHEEEGSAPNVVACSAKDTLAIQQFRCSDAIRTQRCSKLKVEFVDIRHVWMGFFREEIAQGVVDPAYKRAFCDFQKSAIDALIATLERFV